jgi:hypothetical protein
MGTITSLNGVPCGDINAVNNLLAGAGGDILKWDDNTFCPVPTATPTPTPTPTPSPTPGGPTPTPEPTPTPCPPYCCYSEICYSERECSEACQCNDVRGLYLHITCSDFDCNLAFADGIYNDELCTDPADRGYYSNGADCWYWDSSNLTLTYQGPC